VMHMQYSADAIGGSGIGSGTSATGLGVHLRYWSLHCMPETVRATQISIGLLRRIANFNGLNFDSRTWRKTKL